MVTSIVLTVGLATSAACFQIGQWLLREGGFNYEGGYPAITLADGDALRAVVLSGVYLGLLALFSLGVGASCCTPPQRSRSCSQPCSLP